jgi:hypothetical protein
LRLLLPYFKWYIWSWVNVRPSDLLKPRYIYFDDFDIWLRRQSSREQRGVREALCLDAQKYTISGQIVACWIPIMLGQACVLAPLYSDWSSGIVSRHIILSWTEILLYSLDINCELTEFPYINSCDINCDLQNFHT